MEMEAATKAQAICTELMDNSATFTELDIRLNEISSEGMVLVGKALEMNTHIVHVTIREGTLSVRAALSLASALEKHPAVEKLSLVHVDIIEFSAIALAFQKNEMLRKLSVEGVDMKLGLLACLRSLLEANAIASLTIEQLRSGCRLNEGHVIDLSGPLQYNQSLVQLILKAGGQEELIFSPQMVQDVPRLIRANKGIRKIALESNVISPLGMALIASAVEQHTSLEELTLVDCSPDDNLETEVVER